MKHQIVTGFWLFLLLPATSFSVDLEFSGWKPFSPRDEIRPNFAVEESGGPDGSGGLVILHDEREGLDGAWKKTYEVEGGSYHRIRAFAKTSGVANPRYHTYVELLFHECPCVLEHEFLGCELYGL